MANLRQGTYGNYYGSLYSESESLTQSEMEVNASYIYKALSGWSINAVSALLGNLQAESTMNPGRWQSENVGNTEGGYGLVQWTPASKYIDWCTVNELSDPSEMDNNIARILREVEFDMQWIATADYPLSFEQFTQSTESVAYLAECFLMCYERPADQSQTVKDYRSSLANKWYAYISGEPVPDEPDNPGIITNTRKKKYNFLILNARRRRETWIR